MFSHSSLCDLFFYHLNNCHVLATTTITSAAAASRTHSDVYFGCEWIKNPFMQKLSAFFCSLSVYILCIQNSPATYEQYVFSEAENKAHRIYMFIIINHPHAAATAFCWIHFSTLWVLHTKKWTWHICLISTVAHLAFVNFFPHEIHSREWVKLIPRIIFVAVHWIESLSS